MKRLFVIITIIAMLIVNTNVAHADSGSVSVSASGSVTLGNSVTVSVTLSCDTGVGGGIVLVSYDSNYFSLSSYNMNGNTLSGNRVLIEPTANHSVSFSLTFTAKQVGSSNITINTSQFISYENYSSVSGYSGSITKTINVVAKTENNTSTTTTLSSDASLSALSIANVPFEQGFYSNVYEYTAYAPLGTTKVDINARANSSKAKVDVSTYSVSEGWNTINVVCTAQDNTKKTYKMNIYVEESPTVFYEDGKLGLVKNLDRISSPEGFEKEEITVGENNITLFNHNKLDLVYLADENNEKDFYLYDRETDSVSGKYEPVLINDKSFIILDFDYENFPEMDEQFVKNLVKIDDNRYFGWAYKADNMKDYKIVYLKDGEGNNQLYSYDELEKTLQRFTLALNTEEEVEEVEEKMPVEMLIAYCLAAAGSVSFIAAIIMTAKNKKKK